MKREIKFRAWDADKKRMIYFENEDMWDTNWLNHHLVMQFTGLRDRTGKEIFEGDYIQLSGGLRLDFYPDNGQIIFNNHTASFVMKALNDCNVYMNFSLGYSDGTEIEVIGNIYENPELIK